MSEGRGIRWGWLLVRVFAGLVVLVVLLAVVIHLGPTRSFVLRQVLPLAGRANIRVEATDLSYNLFRLRASVSGVKVSAINRPDLPFFEADNVTVLAPPGILRGIVAFTRVDIAGGRVRIVRTPAGSNLPTSRNPSTAEPAPLRLGHVVGDLVVDVRDEVANYSISAPSVRLDLSPGDGQIVIGAGTVGLHGQTINVLQLAGGATFDGRSMTLQNANLASDVANSKVDGTLTLVTRTPSMDLRVDGQGSVARLAALATPEKVFDGEVSFQGSVAGPFGSPVADLRVQSARLDRERLVLTDVDLATRVDTRGAEISRSAFGVAGGRVDANAHLAFDGSTNRVDGTWRNVNVASLLDALVPSQRVLPAGQSSGRLSSTGTGYQLSQWATAAQVTVAGGDNAPARLAAPGNSRFDMRAGRWQLSGQHNVGDVAPVGFMLNGRVVGNAQPVAGSVMLGETPVSGLSSVLNLVGLTNLPPEMFRAGTMTFGGTVGGMVTRPTLAGTANVMGLRGDAYALGPARVVLSGTPFDPLLQLQLNADSLQSAGQSVTNVEAAGQLRETTLTLSSFSGAELDAMGVVRGSGSFDFSSKGYQLQADVTGWNLDRISNQPFKGLLTLNFIGAGTMDRPSGEAQITVADASYADIVLGGIAGRATLDGARADVSVEIPLLNVRGNGQTELSPPYKTIADVSAQNFDLSRLQPLLKGRSTPLVGTATGSAHAEGTLNAWRDANVMLDVSAAETTIGDLAVMLDGPAQVTYSAGTVTTARVGARAGGLQAEVRGTLPIDATPGSTSAMTLTVIGDLGDVVTATRSTRLTDVPPITGSGPVALLARVEGSLRSPDISADLDIGPASVSAPDMPTVEGLRVLGHVQDGHADIQNLTASIDGAQVAATASGPLSWIAPSLPQQPDMSRAMAKLSAKLTNVTTALLGRLAMGRVVSDVTGSLDATIDVSSATPKLEGITGEARIDRLQVSAAGVAVTQAEPTRVVAENGVARIASWDWSGEGTSIKVDGQVRLADLNAGINANGDLDLRLLSPFLRASGVATAGSLTPKLTISGKLTQPSIDGEIGISNAEVRLTTPRVFVGGLTGRAVVTRDMLELQSMTGSINGGTLTVGGTASFKTATSATAAVTAEIKGMALEYPEGLRTEIDGTLMLDLGEETPELARQPLLSGNVHVVNGSYREPIAVVGGVLAALQSRVSAVPPPVVRAPGASEGLALDISVTTDEDLFVDNNAATLSIDADVGVLGKFAQPLLAGHAEVREGGRVLLGRNTYQITSGTLDFANPNKIDPLLNFQLTTRAGGVEIDVALTGTASAPMVALSSPDAEYGQSDLTALLLTGRTLDQLGSADAAVVGNVLVGNLSGELGQVLGVAGRAVGIDTIRLGGIDNSTLQSDPSAIATETDPTSRLTFTKALGANFDLTFSQSLRDGDQQTWVLEYRPTKRLIARLVSDDDNLRRYEFRHDVRIGSQPMGRASASSKRPSIKVSAVDIQGQLPGQDLRSRLKLKPGKTFTFDTLQDDRDRIEQAYRDQNYLTVRVGAQQMRSGETIAVTFTIQPGPKTLIKVMGDPVTQDITDAVANLWADSIAGPLFVDEARTLVTDRLAAQGYFRATVDARLDVASDAQTLQLTVGKGERTTQVSIVIAGVSDELADDLNDRLKLERLVATAPRNPQAITDSVVLQLNEKGYLRPQVTVDSPVYEGQMVTVTVHIQPREELLLGPITITGGTLPDERVRTTLDLTEGLPYLQAAVDNAQGYLAQFYRQEGYADSTVSVKAEEAVDGVIPISVTVTEGPRQVVAAVDVRGLRHIDEDVAQRAMDLDPGDPARAEALLAARTKLYATGLFRRVDMQSTPDSDATATAGQVPVRVIVTVEEWPALRFRYGVQLAEERPDEGSGRRELVPGFSADIVRRTLFSRALSVGAATVLQRRDREGRIFVTAPTFLSRSIRSSLTLQKEREVFGQENVADTSRISWEQRTKKFVNNHLELSYSYKFERTHQFSEAPPNPLLPAFDITIYVARLTATAAWDSRNDASAPIRGSLFTATYEEAPTWSGSDFRFIRYFAQARHFQAWKQVIFASAGQWGLVTPLGGQEVIPSERFYTGGGTSIRGLPEDGAGPHDILGPTGGRLLLLFNQEARVPIYGWFQGVAFIDSGNVFLEPKNVGWGDLFTSVGLGVRVVTPFALLRVDFGHLVRGGTNGSQGRWVFGIGHAF